MGRRTLWEKEKLLVTSNFSFFPQCFQKTCTADTKTQGLDWESFESPFPSLPQHEIEVGITNNPFSKQALIFTCLQHKSNENTMGKGEIARNEQFLLFPQCSSTHLENSLPFSSNLKLSSAISFSLVESKICRSGKG